MAIVNTKAAAITAGDTAGTLAKKSLSGAILKESCGTLEAVSGDSIASVYRLARVPSNARVSRVLIGCDAITTCAGDVGVYDIAAAGGAVVDADLFTSAQSLATAIVINTDVTHESGIYGVEDVEQPLWQALGLTADPGKLYDIAITLTAAAGSAGTVSLKVQYADGN